MHLLRTNEPANCGQRQPSDSCVNIQVSQGTSKLANSVEDLKMCIYNSKSSASAGEEQCLKVVVTELKSPALIKPLDTQQESPHKPGEKLQSALKVAHDENRVIIGVPSAVKYLSATPEDTLFCILAPPKMDDSAAHIQEVLLKAFCFENDIYVIEVRDRIRLLLP